MAIFVLQFLSDYVYTIDSDLLWSHIGLLALTELCNWNVHQLAYSSLMDLNSAPPIVYPN